MTATAAELRKARRAALNDLDWHWGEAYDLAVTGAGWMAKRLDNGRSLVAAGPAELRALIVADYAAAPVPRDLPARSAAVVMSGCPLRPIPAALVQAAALRAAFPGYAFSVLLHHGDTPRLEAVRRDGGDPYCLISADARDLWRELREAWPSRT